MHNDDIGPDQNDTGKPVGFGRLAYDPLTRTFWYFGLGLSNDQGGQYIGQTNFGSKSLSDLLAVLKHHITQMQDELHTRTLEKIHDKQG